MKIRNISGFKMALEVSPENGFLKINLGPTHGTWVKDIRELNKNITRSLRLNNKYLEKEYDRFRKKVTKVLRVIYLFRHADKPAQYAEKLSQLKEDAKTQVRLGNKSIDKLIRKDLINSEMASSLFNDGSNVNDSIKNFSHRCGSYYLIITYVGIVLEK